MLSTDDMKTPSLEFDPIASAGTLEIPPGESTVTHRVVDNQTSKLDPFIAVDDFSVRYPAAFLDHPHRGFESMTFVLPEQESPDSRLLYYDSTLGQEERALGPGGLVRMVCGSGISHCEVVRDDQNRTMRAINWWFNYPEAEKYCAPWSGICEMNTERMPVRVRDGIRTIVLQGTFAGISGHCFEPCPVPMECAHVTLSAGRSFHINVPTGWNGIVYCIRGSGCVNGEWLSGIESNDRIVGRELAAGARSKPPWAFGRNG